MNAASISASRYRGTAPSIRLNVVISMRSYAHRTGLSPPDAMWAQAGFGFSIPRYDDDAKPGLVTHHATVRFLGFLERKRFGHGMHAGHRRESHRVFRINRRTRRPTIDSVSPPNQG